MSQHDVNRALQGAIEASRLGNDREFDRLRTLIGESSERMEGSITRIERSSERVEQAVDRIEFQVGTLSEHIARIDIKLERLIDLVQQQNAVAASQAATADKNADTVRELAALVRLTLERNGSGTN
ncbi:MAG: hypothetical protein VKK04_25610 [Synechococcales bacterium]|nr:hypothetical protein [Synechococcales bacterium]